MQLQLPYTNYTTPQQQLRYTTTTTTAALHHYIQQLWVRWPARWPLQPLQPFQKTQLQPPFGPSVDSLCHPWFTTTNPSYRFPIFETSATALCGTTGTVCFSWFPQISHSAPFLQLIDHETQRIRWQHLDHLLHNEVAMHVAAAVEPWDNQSLPQWWGQSTTICIIPALLQRTARVSKTAINCNIGVVSRQPSFAHTKCVSTAQNCNKTYVSWHFEAFWVVQTAFVRRRFCVKTSVCESVCARNRVKVPLCKNACGECKPHFLEQRSHLQAKKLGEDSVG